MTRGKIFRPSKPLFTLLHVAAVKSENETDKQTDKPIDSVKKERVSKVTPIKMLLLSFATFSIFIGKKSSLGSSVARTSS